MEELSHRALHTEDTRRKSSKVKRRKENKKVPIFKERIQKIILKETINKETSKVIEETKRSLKDLDFG